MDFFYAYVDRCNFWCLTEVIFDVWHHEPCICVTCFFVPVIYHKFSHGDIFYRLNGENVNIMLEYVFEGTLTILFSWHRSFLCLQLDEDQDSDDLLDDDLLAGNGYVILVFTLSLYWKPVFGVCDQFRLKLACSADETS